MKRIGVRKVKQCPFCGGDPKLVELNKGFAGFTGDIYDYAIKCGKCRAVTATRHSIDDAIDVWNRRVSDED